MSSPGTDGPPPANPILDAYEAFKHETPLVTRSLLLSLFGTWLLSFTLNLEAALANIPQFTIYEFELYRIFLSPFICKSIFSLIFAYLSFASFGRQMERSIGSTAFGYLLLLLGVSTNMLFLLLAVIVSAMTGVSTALLWSSYGIWIVLFGVIAIECSKAPPDSQRQLFFWSVPTKFYPLALVGFFSLLGGFQVSYFLAVAVGFAYGHGYMNRLKIESLTCKKLEEGCLNGLTRQQGWIAWDAASGTEGSWSEGQGLTFSNILRRQANEPLHNQPTSGSALDRSEATSVRFPPETEGRKLGSATRRTQTPARDVREARLKALEQKSEADRGKKIDNIV